MNQMKTYLKNLLMKMKGQAMTIDVLQNSPSVYTVFLDASLRPLRIGEDKEPPEGAFPQTFVGINDIRNAYPGAALNMIRGYEESPSKTVAPVSDSEVQALVAKYEAASSLPATPVQKSPVVDSMSLSPQPTTVTSFDTFESKRHEVLLLFAKKYAEFKYAGKRDKQELKNYCNGMARVLQLLYPDSERELRQIIEDRDTSDGELV